MRLRGFTLIEMCVVIAILGVIAALAVPALGGVLATTRGNAETEAVAAFADAARQLAVSEGRCVRIVERGVTLQMEKRITGDCVNLASQTGAAGWEPVEVTTPPPGVVYDLVGQSLTLPAAPVNDDDHRIIFRPSGRLWGDGDLDIGDDGARIVVKTSTGAPFRAVIITAVGRICTRNHGNTLPAIATPGAVTCP